MNFDKSDIIQLAQPVHDLFVHLGFFFLIYGAVVFLKDRKSPFEIMKYFVLVFAVIGLISVWSELLFGMKTGINAVASESSSKMTRVFDTLKDGFENHSSSGSMFSIVDNIKSIVSALMNITLQTLMYIGYLIKRAYNLIQSGLIVAMWIVSPLTLVFLTSKTFFSQGTRYVLASLSLTMWSVGFLMVDFIVATMCLSLLKSMPGTPSPPDGSVLDELLFLSENILTIKVIEAELLIGLIAIALFAIFLYLLAPVLIFTILSGGSPGGVTSKAAVLAGGAGLGMGALALGGKKGGGDQNSDNGLGNLFGGGGNSGGGGSGGGGNSGGGGSGGGGNSPFEQMMSAMGNDTGGGMAQDKSAPPSGGTIGSQTQGSSGGEGKQKHNGGSFSVLDIAKETADTASQVVEENSKGSQA